MVQLGEKMWFQKIGEEGINSTPKTKNSRNLCRSSGSNKSNSFHCQEWRYAVPQLDTSDLK